MAPHWALRGASGVAKPEAKEPNRLESSVGRKPPRHTEVTKAENVASDAARYSWSGKPAPASTLLAQLCACVRVRFRRERPVEARRTVRGPDVALTV